MSFNQQGFSARFQKMGDEAEGVFERVWPDNYVRFGLNRPPLHMASLPERLRHMPDYLTSKGFVECKGIGRDDTVKIKVGEFSCMNFWHQVFPLQLFVWSTTRWAYAVTDLTDVRALIDDLQVDLQKYHDGKAYFAIDGKHFAWTELERI